MLILSFVYNFETVLSIYHFTMPRKARPVTKVSSQASPPSPAASSSGEEEGKGHLPRGFAIVDRKQLARPKRAVTRNINMKEEEDDATASSSSSSSDGEFVASKKQSKKKKHVPKKAKTAAVAKKKMNVNKKKAPPKEATAGKKSTKSTKKKQTGIDKSEYEVKIPVPRPTRYPAQDGASPSPGQGSSATFSSSGSHHVQTYVTNDWRIRSAMDY